MGLGKCRCSSKDSSNNDQDDYKLSIHIFP
jgi:hypothetical protein